MPIPNPSIDDTTFEKILSDAIKRIPQYSELWTDHNISDPGITILDLFSWLADIQAYSLDRISLKNKLKMLKLLGTYPQPPQPAKIMASLNSKKVVILPKDSQLFFDKEQEIVFETDKDFVINPISINKILIHPSPKDKLEGEEFGTNEDFYPFGENPKPDNFLLLGLKLNEHNREEFRIYFSIKQQDMDNYPVGEHCEFDNIYHSSEVSWEFFTKADYENSEGNWLRLQIKEDATNCFTKSGVVRFDLPFQNEDETKSCNGLISENNEPLLWIRCMVTSPQFESAPQIENIRLNPITATQGKSIIEKLESESLKITTRSIETQHKPIIHVKHLGFSVVDTDWSEVNDFDSSDPEDLHFVVNNKEGKIFFGDNINGRIPPKGATFEIEYRYGEILDKKISTSFLNTPYLEKIFSEVMNINIFEFTKGQGAETVNEAILRIRKDLKKPYKAVTTKDFEYLARETPGLRIVRASAYVDEKTNTVNVIVVPYSNTEKRPMPSSGFMQTVFEHLNQHRLLTTKINVVGPNYVSISVSASIRIKERHAPEIVRKQAIDALNKFLSPVSKVKSWPLGRSVYKSDIYSILEDVEGIEGVESLSIYEKGKKDTFGNEDGEVRISDSSLVYLGTHDINTISSYERYSEESLEKGIS